MSGDAGLQVDKESSEKPNGLFVNELNSGSTHFCTQCGGVATFSVFLVDANKVVWKKLMCDRCSEKTHESYMKGRAEQEALEKAAALAQRLNEEGKLKTAQA